MEEYMEQLKNVSIPRKVLLNPGPATTTDTVKLSQLVPDICPREKEFGEIMRTMSQDLVKIVHGDNSFTAVLFCGSGTINIDVCLNSLLPENKKALIINNGAYSARAVQVCEYYGLPHINLQSSVYELPSLEDIEKTLQENTDIALVYTTHHETGSGLLNPIKEIGALAHKYGAIFVVDTTSSYAMLPINIIESNVDFCMASAQKGLMSFTGLSFVVGRKDIIEKSKNYPKRSYYCNLYMQYDYFEKTGQMHFTPPVQTIYATKQAIEEYFAEGEQEKYNRHLSAYKAVREGLNRLGFKVPLKDEYHAGLVVSVLYPDDENWDFEKVHDYCYERGFTIYPGKIDRADTFRICTLGAITAKDIEDFFVVLEEGMKELGISTPVSYKEDK